MLQAKNVKVILPQEIGNMVVQNDPSLQKEVKSRGTPSLGSPHHTHSLYMICHHQQCFLPPNILLIFIIFIGRQQLISTAVEHKEWWMGGNWEGMGGTGELKPAISIQNSPPTQISQQEIQRNNG